MRTSLDAIDEKIIDLMQENARISIKDIAYLSAATHHEFALLRGKTRDIIVHGVERHCYFNYCFIRYFKICIYCNVKYKYNYLDLITS